METFGKKSPSYSTVTQWAVDFKKGRESLEHDGRAGCPKDATAEENVIVAHTLVICDRRRDLGSIASEVGFSFGAINPNRHLRYVKGFGKMGATNVDR